MSEDGTGSRATEFLGVTTPVGWKSRLKTKAGGNISAAVCLAVSQTYGWPYKLASSGRSSIQADIVSRLPSSVVRQLVSSLGLGVVARTVERSNLSELSVRLIDPETGITSDRPAGQRDRRPIAQKQRKILAAIVARQRE